MVEQLYWLTEQLPGVALDELPLFPCKNGTAATQTTMVGSICRVAELLGETLTDQLGRNNLVGTPFVLRDRGGWHV